MGSVWVEPYDTKREEMFRIRIEKPDGTRYSYRETFFSKRTAQKVADNLAELLAEGKKIKEQKKFGERFKAYLENLDDRIRAGDPKMKESTKRIIESSFVHILPIFEDKFIDGLSTIDLNIYKNDLLKIKNVGGVNRVLVDLRTFLNWCVNMGDIEKSPMKGVKLFKSAFKGYFFNRRELALIYKESKISKAGACGGPTERLWWAAYVLKETGLRLEEFIGIDWPDLEENAVWVTGKTGRRLVPLTPVARYTLLKILKQPWSYSGIEAAWRNMIRKTGIINPLAIHKKTGLPMPPRLHDLRHSFASTYLAKGNSLANLMQIGGWKTLKAVEIYMHPDIPNLLRTMQKKVRK